MNQSEAKSRLSELRALMSQYAYQYYVLDEPTVNDAIYDGLMTELQQLETEYPQFITRDSPSQRVEGTPAAALEEFPTPKRWMPLLRLFRFEAHKS